MGIVASAIKAQHRLTEGDRLTGLPTYGGDPGGVQAAEVTKPIYPARTLSNPSTNTNRKVIYQFLLSCKTR